MRWLSSRLCPPRCYLLFVYGTVTDKRERGRRWGLSSARFVLRSTSGRCSKVVRAQTSALPAGGVSFRARFSSGAVVRNGLVGAPSAVTPAPPSAMEHDDERSLSLGTELSASVPPPSPLTGCYLLAVIGEPHTHEHKEIILQRLVKGQFLTPLCPDLVYVKFQSFV